MNITSLTVEVKSVGIKQASQELGGLSTSAANATRRIENLIIATQKLQAAHVASATAAQALVGHLQQQATLMARFRGDAMASSASVQALAQATTLLAAAMAALNAQQQLADRTQRRHNEGMREAHGLARGLAGSLGALWVTYGNLAGMAVGVAIGASLKAVVTMGKDVEHTLEGIRVRGVESMDSINKMRESLLNLGKGVYGPQQVANAFETLILAGLNAEQALSSITAALNLATVGGTSIEKSAQTLVSVGSSIGYTAEGFSRIGDVISKTAALSMSSVETLSEAFKSASSVSKLYGVSLEDLATSLGVLSNLGIQGSAAGTALKNMYKELASESDKVQGTFKKMGMSTNSLRDAQGNFKPLIAMVSELDKGLSTLSAKEEKDAIARLSNERGMRLMVQALDVYRQKTEDGTSALEKFRQQAGDSYGFAAKGAMQMAMTAKSQIESMMNTLKTVFVETFKSVEPQVVLFSRSMKDAFQSKEFKDAILGIAGAFAKMSLAMAENIGIISKLVAAFILFKAGLMIGGVVTTLATAVTALNASLVALRAGAIATALAIPGLNGVLAAAAVAWGVYEMAKKKATAADETKVAKAYSSDMIERMKQETEEINKQTKLIEKKMSAQDAAAKVERDTARDKMLANYQSAIDVAQAKADKAFGRNAAAYQEAINSVKQNKTAMQAEKERYELAEKAFVAANKAKAAAIEANAKNVPGRPDPTNTLAGDPDKAVINDGYAAAIAKQDALIRSARRAMSAFEEQENLRFKAGQMGKLQMIEEIGKQQVDKYGEIQAAIAAKLTAARGKGDQSEVQRYLGEQQQAKEDFANKEITNEAAKQLALQRSVEEYTDYRIAQLEKEGAYSTAANLRFQKEHKAAFLQAQKDAAAYGDVYPILNQRVEAFKALQKQAMKDALNKEAVKEFTDAADATRNALKGVQTASEGQGLAAMFEAAMEASRRYQADLPNLQASMKLMTNPADINEAQAKLTNLAENQRKMWVGIGESIGNTLESAFGRGGKAMGDLFEVATKYDRLENKTGMARVKAFGDAAGAAKNFFKEGTTGYKVLEGAEKAFRVVELAGMAASLAANIANAATVAAAWVPAVFASFMATLGPFGTAAAAAALAAVGISAFSGSGSASSSEQRQKTQGTGSVLGMTDAKSESIARSLEHLEKDSGLGLYHTSEMVKSLKSIQNSIGSLASFIVSSTGISGNGYEGLNKEGFLNSKGIRIAGGLAGGVAGAAVGTSIGMGSFMSAGAALGGPIGLALGAILGGVLGSSLGKIFGGKQSVTDTGFTLDRTTVGAGNVNASAYTDIKKDGGWFRSDKHSTQMSSMGSEANAQFAKVIDNMASGLTAASKMLGIGGDSFTQKLNSFVIDIGKISLKDKTGEEIEKELNAVFSKLGDDMARWAIGGLEQFQKVGEGYLETVARVASNLVQVKDVFSVLGKSLDLTGASAVNVSEHLVELAGGIESLTESTKFYVDNFLTTAERMAPITKSVNDRLAELGLGELKTIELYKQKIQSLNLMNAADRELYVNMIELAPAFKEAADYAQDLIDGTVDLTDAQEKALDRINDARSALQDAYDKEKSALQGVIDKTKSFIQTLATYKDSLKLGSDSPLTNMQKYDEAKFQIESVVQKALAGDQSAKDKFTSVANSFLAASKVVNASGAAYTNDFNYIQNMIDKLMTGSQGEVTTAEASLAALEKQVAGLLEVNKSVLTVAQAIVNLQAAIAGGYNAGLTNAQMGGSNITPPPIVNGVQQSNVDANKFTEALFAIGTEVAALRQEQKAQVGAQVAAEIEGTDRIIESLQTKGATNKPAVKLA